MNQDLTVGSPTKVLWRFCIPLFGSVVFQQLYNLADSWVAGKFIGVNALAAVGNSYEITLIFIAIAFGCNIGCSVITSQYFGAKEYSKMKTTVYTTMIASAVLCGLLMLFGIFGSGALLRAIHTPEDIFSDSKLYLDIYMWGLPFVFFYNISTGIFSALGDSRTPFWFLAASSTSNILMDILFVQGFKMGVAGVAWATFLCQGICCTLAILVVLRRLRRVKVVGHVPVFSSRLLGKVAIIAIPSALQQSFISLGNIIIQRMINNFGTSVVAGYSASVKLNNLVVTSFTTMGNGISNYAAQNLGAKKSDRLSSGFRASLCMAASIAVPLSILYFTCGNPMLHFFMKDPTAGAMSAGMAFLRILSPFYIVVAAKLVADGILRGTGRMKVFMITTFTDLILRVALAGILSSTAMGSLGIWSSWPIGWTVGTVLSVFFCVKAIHDIHVSMQAQAQTVSEI